MSRADCWAVGSFLAHRENRNEALHWNGHRWSFVRTPDPGTLANSLRSVACASSADCWAVGNSENGDDSSPETLTELNEALHWNGRSWSVVSTPNPDGTAPGDANELRSVTCTSPASCWAVGELSRDFSVPLNEALHWNGRQWSQVEAPAPGDFSSLSSVRCTSAASCWAVGSAGVPGLIQTQALHWDGTGWSQLPTPPAKPSSVAGGLQAVRCTSPANCWAVGGAGHGTRLLNVALHWNGRSWSSVHVPNSGRASRMVRNSLESVTCVSAANCWAVGSRQFNEGTNSAVRNRVLHWNGARWSAVRAPNPGGTVRFANNQLFGVACTSSSNCWAVGYDSRSAAVPQHNSRNQLLHWNGHRWIRR